MTILYLRDTLRVCGPGKTIINTCKTIDRGRYRLLVSAPVGEGGRTNEFLTRVRETGTDIAPLAMSSTVDLIPDLVRLLVLLRRHRVSILQTHDAQTRRIGTLAAALAGVPHVTSVHGWIFNTRKQKLARWFDRLLLRRTARVIVMSEQMAKEVAKLGVDPSAIEVLYNAIVLEDYPAGYASRRVRREFGIPDDHAVVAIIGRLSAEKGHSLFLEMSVRLAPVYPKVTFVVVGDGPLLGSLRDSVKARGLDGRVMFTGFRTDMLDIYAALDILVIASSTEGLPNVLLEAFACRKPAVATPVGGIPEVLAHGRNGFLVPYGDVDALTRSVETLLADPIRAAAMGRAARETIEAVFSFEARTRKLERLYEAVLDGAATRDVAG